MKIKNIEIFALNRHYGNRALVFHKQILLQVEYKYLSSIFIVSVATGYIGL